MLWGPNPWRWSSRNTPRPVPSPPPPACTWPLNKFMCASELVQNVLSVSHCHGNPGASFWLSSGALSRVLCAFGREALLGAWPACVGGAAAWLPELTVLRQPPPPPPPPPRHWLTLEPGNSQWQGVDFFFNHCYFKSLGFLLLTQGGAKLWRPACPFSKKP